VHEDAFFARWTGVLHALVALAALFTVASPLFALAHECPLELRQGQDVWKMDLRDLHAVDFAAIAGLSLAPRIVWLVVLWEVSGLARCYRRGHIFEECNARCFIRLGGLLTVMGTMHCIIAPISIYYLYWRGVSPWLGEISLIQQIQLDYIMAGLFFVIFGNVMRHAIELEENHRLIV
jgi:hypothetical protein